MMNIDACFTEHPQHITPLHYNIIKGPTRVHEMPSISEELPWTEASNVIETENLLRRNTSSNN